MSGQAMDDIVELLRPTYDITSQAWWQRGKLAADEIERLRYALKQIKGLKSRPIGDTGWATGPQALLNRAKRIARDALKSPSQKLTCH